LRHVGLASVFGSVSVSVFGPLHRPRAGVDHEQPTPQSFLLGNERADCCIIGRTPGCQRVAEMFAVERQRVRLDSGRFNDPAGAA